MNARVNWKMHCAKVVLEAASASAGAERQALLDAALFHLITAYRCYLGEILALSSQPPVLVDARQAQSYLREHSIQVSPELEELIQLEQGRGWLQSLLVAYTEITAITEPARRGGEELALVDITASAGVDDCRRWLDQLQCLMQRQREHAREW